VPTAQVLEAGCPRLGPGELGVAEPEPAHAGRTFGQQRQERTEDGGGPGDVAGGHGLIEDVLEERDEGGRWRAGVGDPVVEVSAAEPGALPHLVLPVGEHAVPGSGAEEDGVPFDMVGGQRLRASGAAAQTAGVDGGDGAGRVLVTDLAE
jgi:hypothetical protein